MPYINHADRNRLDCAIVNQIIPNNEGELNYAISTIILNYIKTHGLRYHNIARVTGVLKNVSDEFNRRIVAPYEDAKIKENGDLPGFQIISSNQ